MSKNLEGTATAERLHKAQLKALEKVVDRVIALEQGSLIADGPLAEVVRNERVLSTYLGSAAPAAKAGGQGC